jgi:hypothetical protein
MPLSEHEERILAEIERRLAEDDPRFVERARRASATERRVRRVRLAVVGFVVGFVLLLGLTFHVALGIIGFALMFASVVIGVGAVSQGGTDDRGSFVERFRRLLRGRDHAS